ncbi:MAG: D-cysteine desulfhydrase, partial [Pseudomonadota bacterium]
QHEGILMDPVYAGKAMGGLLDLIQNGELDGADNVVFIHTGGTPALFAYTDTFMNDS